MKDEKVIEIFRSAEALLEGHFIYTSGRHGTQFIQAARVLQYPQYCEQLCAAMAERFADDNIDLVVGPATGGIVLAYDTARFLKCSNAFTEKDDEGGMSMKRGFSLKTGARVLVVEDIVTTGGSISKTISHLRKRGAEIVGVSVLVDRSSGKASFPYKYEPLARLDMKSWEPMECELCRSGIPLIEPDTLLG